MLKFVLRRLLVTLPMLILMCLLTFITMQKTVGSYYDLLRMDPLISPETIDRYVHLYQLDRPLFWQFFSWLKNIAHFEFGYSFYYNIPVAKVIAGRVANTFILSLASLVLTWGVAIPLGIWAALRRNQLVDRFIQLCSYAALSAPGFLVAILMLYVASRTGILPLGGMHSANYDELNLLGRILDVLRHLVIPATALSLASVGSLQKIMRSNMLDTLRQQYILTARAKGLPEHRIIYVHALRNAINPLITLLGYEFAGLLSGAAILETLCGWPGLGALMLKAVMTKDIYLVMASLLMGGFLLIVGNLIADIFLARLDPRIRYEK